MGQMSMNMVIHAAVRRDLRRFERTLEALAPEDAARARLLHRAWRHFHDQLHHHHHSEHDIVWPALTSYGVDPALLTQLDGEHDLMAAALGETDEAMDRLLESPSSEQVARTLAAVRHLHQVTGSHLDHEERELEPVLQGGFLGSPEARQMEKQLRAGGLRQAGTMLSWVSDGAGLEEQRTLRAAVPAPLRLLLLGPLGRGYRREVAPAWR